MSKFSLKKKIAASVVVAASLSGAVAAYAYWSTSGTGTGTAATAAENSVPTFGTGVVASAVGLGETALVPGGAADTFSVKVENKNPGSISAGLVSAGITTGWTVPADADGPACVATDFTVVSNTVDSVGVLAKAGTTTGSPTDSTTITGFSIKLNDDIAKDQDNCKSAAPALTFTVAQN